MATGPACVDFKYEEIGRFSWNLSGREFYNDERLMRYYVKPSAEVPNFSLREGLETWVPPNCVKDDIDEMLMWVMHNQHKFQGHSASGDKMTSLNTDFICKRGLLARVMCAPYENNEELLIAVTKFRGTYFMCEVSESALEEDEEEGEQEEEKKKQLQEEKKKVQKEERQEEKKEEEVESRKERKKGEGQEEERKEERKEEGRKEKREEEDLNDAILAFLDKELEETLYGGYKFEQCVTADAPGGQPDTTKPVDSNDMFFRVVRATVGSHSLTYCGEVDAYDPEMEGENKFVELKTTRVHPLLIPRKMISFKRHKLLKTWAQSIMMGVDRVIYGFRDDKGIVCSIQEFTTSKIPAFVEDIYSPWDPRICFSFLHQYLSLVKSRISVANPKAVYLLTWKPGPKPISKPHYDPIKDVVCERQGRDSKFAFLPQWFVDWDGWSKGK